MSAPTHAELILNLVVDGLGRGLRPVITAAGRPWTSVAATPSTLTARRRAESSAAEGGKQRSDRGKAASWEQQLGVRSASTGALLPPAAPRKVGHECIARGWSLHWCGGQRSTGMHPYVKPECGWCSATPPLPLSPLPRSWRWQRQRCRPGTYCRWQAALMPAPETATPAAQEAFASFRAVHCAGAS